MSITYFLTDKVCYSCKRPMREPIEIGISSHGWAFHSLISREDLEKVFQDFGQIIINEYGETMSGNSFGYKIIDKKEIDFNKDYCVGYPSWEYFFKENDCYFDKEIGLFRRNKAVNCPGEKIDINLEVKKIEWPSCSS